MLSLGEAEGRLSLDISSFRDGFRSALRQMESFERDADSVSDRVGSSFSGVGASLAKGVTGSLAAAGTAITASVGAASTAVGVLSKNSLDAYASYEQLTGGVETLFKDSASLVMQYADNAYKTAGLSANEYMDTVTSFSAKLLQDLGGNTKAAAEISNTAITDMADNANKMGTSMTMIQNAYQGFAKQNYTMLDNLKLGYGGTQAEMARLINDSGVLGDTMTVTAKTVNDVSFDKIIEAIHVVQTEMGITGTTAKEASTTIEGSLSSVKSAWENLLTGVADSDQDLSGLIDNFVVTLETAASNVVPRVQEIVTNMGSLVDQLAPILVQKVPGIIQSVAPPLVASGAQLAVSLIQGITQALPALGSAIISVIPSIISSFSMLIPEFASIGSQIVPVIVNGIVTGIPMLISYGAQIIQNLASGVQQTLPQLIPLAMQAILDFSSNLRSSAGQLVDAGLALIQSLANGFISNIPTFIATVPQIITNLAGIINDNAPKLIVTAAVLIKNLAVGLVKAIPTLVANIPQIIEAIVAVFTAYNWMNLGKSMITKLRDGIKSMAASVKTSAQNILNNINGVLKNLPTQLKQLGQSGINGLMNGIKSLIGGVSGAIKSIFNAIINGLKSLPSQLLNLGKNIIQGLINGIKSGISGLLSVVGDIGKSVYDKITGFFDIHSPSRLMLWIGQMIMTGLENGITSRIKYVQSATAKVSKTIENEIVRLQDKITEMEEEYQKEQAEKELAEYKKSIQEKYDELSKAELSERESIRQEIAELEQEWADKQKNAARKAEKEALNARIDELESFKSEYENQLEEIVSLQESLTDKLLDSRDLFTKTSKDDKEFFELNDLEDQIDLIDEYSEKLNAISSMDVPESLMDEILGLGVDDAIEYMNSLLAKTPEQFEGYINQYQALQDRAKQIAETFYRDDLNRLDNEFSTKLGEMSDDAYSSGQGMMEGLIDGIKSKEEEAESLAASIARTISNALASAVGAPTIKSNYSVNPVSVSRAASTMALSDNTPDWFGSTSLNRSDYDFNESRFITSMVNGVSTAIKSGLSSFGKGDLTLEIKADKTTIARTFLPDFRKASKQSPEIVSDMV